MPDQRERLHDIAFVRAKNAGPFWTTIDVFFGEHKGFARVVKGKAITPEKVAGLYRVDPRHVRIFELSDLDVIKVTFPRPVVQGSFADRDMHSGQQHLPLAGLVIDA